MTEIEATKACPYCQASIPRGAEKCKACGEWVVKRGECGPYFVVLLLLAVVVFLVSEDAQRPGKSVLAQLRQSLQGLAATDKEKVPATDWVSLPCELRFTSDLAAFHHGRLYEFSDVSVRYNRESLRLEMTFRYPKDSGVYPRVRVDLIDKNQVTLIRSPSVQITHLEGVAATLGAQLVSDSAPNTLSWAFARMYYQDAVMAHVVIQAVD